MFDVGGTRKDKMAIKTTKFNKGKVFLYPSISIKKGGRGMVVTADSIDLGLKAVIVEPVMNNQGSEYIQDNYNVLLDFIRHHNVVEKAEDLLHDVFLSVLDDEHNGHGFDPNYKCENEDDVRTVESYVLGRLKLYCKNAKYSTNYVETARIKRRGNNDKYFESLLDDSGKLSLGLVSKVRHEDKNSDAITVTTSAASWSTDNSGTNDEFQTAYSMAMVVDDTDDITDLLSLREEIDYCIDVGELHGVQVLNLFKNIDIIADAFLDKQKRKVKACESIFSSIIEMVNYNSDFADSLLSVLSYSEKNRSAFEGVIATY